MLWIAATREFSQALLTLRQLHLVGTLVDATLILVRSYLLVTTLPGTAGVCQELVAAAPSARMIACLSLSTAAFLDAPP